MSEKSANVNLEQMKLFEDFLSLARLHKNYSQHFYPPDLYAMDLIADREDLDVAGLIGLWARYRKELPGGMINIYLTTPFCFRHCSCKAAPARLQQCQQSCNHSKEIRLGEW